VPKGANLGPVRGLNCLYVEAIRSFDIEVLRSFELEVLRSFGRGRLEGSMSKDFSGRGIGSPATTALHHQPARDGL